MWIGVWSSWFSGYSSPSSSSVFSLSTLWSDPSPEWCVFSVWSGLIMCGPLLSSSSSSPNPEPLPSLSSSSTLRSSWTFYVFVLDGRKGKISVTKFKSNSDEKVGYTFLNNRQQKRHINCVSIERNDVNNKKMEHREMLN